MPPRGGFSLSLRDTPALGWHPKMESQVYPLDGGLVGLHLRTRVQFRIFQGRPETRCCCVSQFRSGSPRGAFQSEGSVRPMTVLALSKASWASLRYMASSRVPVSCSRALASSRCAFWMYSSTRSRYWAVSLFIGPKCLTQHRLASSGKSRVCGRRFNSAFPKVACEPRFLHSPNPAGAAQPSAGVRLCM